MKKIKDFKELSDEDLQNEIKILKDKSQLRSDIGKLLGVGFLSLGAISLLTVGVFNLGAIIVASASVGGILAGWGFAASAFNCDEKIAQIEKEIKSREELKEQEKINQTKEIKATKSIVKKRTKEQDVTKDNDLGI